MSVQPFATLPVSGDKPSKGSKTAVFRRGSPTSQNQMWSSTCGDWLRALKLLPE
jgi:hypothetical protein